MRQSRRKNRPHRHSGDLVDELQLRNQHNRDIEHLVEKLQLRKLHSFLHCHDTPSRCTPTGMSTTLSKNWTTPTSTTCTTRGIDHLVNVLQLWHLSKHNNGHVNNLQQLHLWKLHGHSVDELKPRHLYVTEGDWWNLSLQNSGTSTTAKRP